MNLNIIRHLFHIMTSQNRALHCYLLMTLWILLLIGGIYKFLEPGQNINEPIVIPADLYQSLANDVKTKRIFRLCNFPEEMIEGNEGALKNAKWQLKGLLVLIRHGDRGPLQHIRKINNINCGIEETPTLSSYKNFLHNLTMTGKLSWVGPGPFHGFPILPLHPNQCQLGQLTMQGVAQLLKVGQLLKSSYETVWPKLRNINANEVLIYSTRYRRTFQSVLAFLYGFISSDTLSKVAILESQSINFCFKDCGCPIMEKLNKQLRNSLAPILKSHPAVAVLAEATGKALFSSGAEQGQLKSDPHSIRDVLLTYLCHRSNLPCDKPQNCIKRQNVAGVFAYTDWVNYQRWRNVYWRRLCLLRSYGLIRHLVQQMLHMLSSSGPYLVVYSGHDNTIEQLTTALGLQNDALLLRYASRLVFEVYHDTTGDLQNRNGVKGVYFRLLANGKDVTKQTSFCRDLVTVVDEDIYLCKIENIVRFLHDDYFVTLNMTNFKDACAMKEEF